MFNAMNKNVKMNTIIANTFRPACTNGFIKHTINTFNRNNIKSIRGTSYFDDI